MDCLIRRRAGRAIVDGRMVVANLATMEDTAVPGFHLRPMEFLRGQHPRPCRA
ncbi:hypothetical protein [Luteibacter sp. RCC_6_2]|jgi:hypothetical protein|uniref:hypothetical protein n=1 Tax=Luteibacter sp. RCC_6_2 TaxID=3239223 RepID=UPI003524F5F9